MVKRDSSPGSTTANVAKCRCSLNRVMIGIFEIRNQPWVDGEAASRGVHGSHVPGHWNTPGHLLCVVDIFQCELVPAIPVAIVHVLPDDGVRTGRPVAVHLHPQASRMIVNYLWHVHIIQEVHQPFVSRRTIVFARFLLKWLLKDLLCHLRAVL